MILCLIVFFIMIEKTEMPPIRKKHSSNGKSKHQADKHRWYTKYTSLHHNLPYTRSQFIKDYVEASNKPKSFSYLKSRGVLRNYANLRLSFHKKRNLQRKHIHVRSYPVHDKPSFKRLSNSSFFEVKFSKLARNGITLPVKTGKRNAVKIILKPNKQLVKDFKIIHYSDLEPELSSNVGGKFLRSNGEEDYEEENKQDYATRQPVQSFPVTSSSISEPIQAILLPQNNSNNSSEKQKWFQLPPPGQEHWFMTSTTSDQNMFETESSTAFTELPEITSQNPLFYSPFKYPESSFQQPTSFQSKNTADPSNLNFASSPANESQINLPPIYGNEPGNFSPLMQVKGKVDDDLNKYPLFKSGQDHWFMTSVTSDQNVFEAKSSSAFTVLPEIKSQNPLFYSPFKYPESSLQQPPSFQSKNIAIPSNLNFVSSPANGLQINLPPMHRMKPGNFSPSVQVKGKVGDDLNKYPLFRSGQDHWFMTSITSDQNVFEAKSSSAFTVPPEVKNQNPMFYSPFQYPGSNLQQSPSFQGKNVEIPSYLNYTSSPANGSQMNLPPMHKMKPGNFFPSVQVKGKVGDDLNKYPLFKPNNNFNEPYKLWIQDGQNNATLKNSGMGQINGTAPSTVLEFFQDKLQRMKKLSRIKGNEIFLGALMIFLLITSVSILVLIKCYKYHKDELRRYPKINTNITFLEVSEQKQNDLLRRIGSIKKYDHLNSNELQ